MKILHTGHNINEVVSQALAKGIYNSHSVYLDKRAAYVKEPCIGYGILRGCEQWFLLNEKHKIDWWNVDKGYLRPGHFDGYYRVSHRNTQGVFNHQDSDYERFTNLAIDIKEWQDNKDGHILVCPPTEHVARFYNATNWLKETLQTLQMNFTNVVKVRYKETLKPLSDDLKGCKMVITFNSSVAWLALLEGIPAYTDKRSVIYSWSKIGIDECHKPIEHLNRINLFSWMANNQYTLEEIAAGKIRLKHERNF
jgi:hypothetical protein